MKKLIILLATVALAAASAATKYNVTLFQPSVVNGTELKPGDYRIEVDGNKAIFKQGKTAIEVPVKVEEASDRHANNSVRYVEGGKLQEIRIGGTHTKLVFDSTPADSPAGAR